MLSACAISQVNHPPFLATKKVFLDARNISNDLLQVAVAKFPPGSSFETHKHADMVEVASPLSCYCAASASDTVCFCGKVFFGIGGTGVLAVGEFAFAAPTRLLRC